MLSFLTKHAQLFFVLGALSILCPVIHMTCEEVVLHTVYHYSTMADFVLPVIFSIIFTVIGMLVMARKSMNI